MLIIPYNIRNPLRDLKDFKTKLEGRESILSVCMC